MRLLVVEDDAALVDGLSKGLSGSGFDGDVTFDGVTRPRCCGSTRPCSTGPGEW